MLKPFDLERMLAGDPVITRDGKRVVDFHYFKDSPNVQRLYVQLEDTENIETFGSDGSYLEHRKSGSDLAMVDKNPKKYYINIYQPNHSGFESDNYIYDSESKALENKHPNGYIKTVSFEVEE